MIDWTTIFDEWQIEKGASEKEIETLANEFHLPLSEKEIAEVEINLLKSKIDIELYNPTKWILPNKPLPQTFLDFLAWNNGGWCRTGEREFGFLATYDLREYTLAYIFPEWMPRSIPFALNGGGVFYVFDMREEPKNSEYPILITESGNLGYEDAVLIASSFIEVCQSTTNIEDLM